MLFNSLPFLYGFLPVTYFVFWRLHTKAQRHIWLAVTGYVFYAFWNYKFCALMALSTIISYLAGLGLLKWDDPRRRRLCLIVPISLDLALLGFFKYSNFAIDTFNRLSAAAGGSHSVPALNIILPVGISFYTFHTITYIVDSYRGVIVPTRSLAEFSCYVSLFAQLVAGPIVRFSYIERDLETIDRSNQHENLERGWSLFAVGLIKKVLVADSIAMLIDPALADYRALGTAGAWACILGYTYQLYFDFSGYSDMAAGLGLLFGLRLPQNFDSPYKASSPADFWRRWHISLSTVLRDYLYIPLGGNRGNLWFIARNLMVTMLLGGLWHGANWTFVVWGGYHGALLVAQRLSAGNLASLPLVVRRVGTFVLVIIGWVFFRSVDFAMAWSLLGAMFTWQHGIEPFRFPWLVAILSIAALFAHVGPNSFELPHRWRMPAVATIAVAFAACLFMFYVGNRTPFLYFQF